jgi:hypothetical protein
MEIPSKSQILAAGSVWLAVLLNLFPGLGTGYIYQRRWRAYWITSVVSTVWFLVGAVRSQDIDPVLLPDRLQRTQLIGLAGFVLIAAVTAWEAANAARRARGLLEEPNPVEPSP